MLVLMHVFITDRAYRMRVHTRRSASEHTKRTVEAGRGAEAWVVDQDAVDIRVVARCVERLLQVILVDLHSAAQLAGRQARACPAEQSGCTLGHVSASQRIASGRGRRGAALRRLRAHWQRVGRILMRAAGGRWHCTGAARARYLAHFKSDAVGLARLHGPF